jgi:hypothetical protein
MRTCVLFRGWPSEIEVQRKDLAAADSRYITQIPQTHRPYEGCAWDWLDTAPGALA